MTSATPVSHPAASTPRPLRRRRFGPAVAIGALAVLLAGCSSTIEPDGAAKSVTEVVTEQSGFEPTDVTCPSGVEATVGEEFECQFTGPDGPYVASVEITKVDGEDVEFFIESRIRE